MRMPRKGMWGQFTSGTHPPKRPSAGVERELELESGPSETREPRGKSSKEQIQGSREFTKNRQRP